MKSNRCWLGLFTGLVFTCGCATNTSPTHLTINTAGADRSEERHEPASASISDEEDEVRAALAELQSEVVTLRRQVAALEASERNEANSETPQKVVVRRTISDEGVKQADFEEPTPRRDVPPAKSHPKLECDSDTRCILEQAISAQKTALRTIANNLANANTAGFKKDRVNFEDAGYRRQTLPGVQDNAGNTTPVGIATGRGSRVSSTQTDFSQGVLRATGRQLDVAIEGNGFFQVQDPNGQIHYTRAGNFSTNANQQLVVGSASTGRILDPPITIPQDATNVVIEPGGRVMVQQANNPTMQNAGQITLAMFINPQGLLKLGENLYAQSGASNTPTQVNPGLQGAGALRQNVLEASNVDFDAEVLEFSAVTKRLQRLRRLLADE